VSVSTLSIGDSVLGGAAALLTAYELWLFSRRPAHAEHLWMGVTSLMAAAYAGLMAVHYNVGAETALLLSRIEGAVLGVTAFATLAWSLTVAGRATPRALAVLWACALPPVGLTLSPWVITGVHAVTLPLGEGVFWRRNVSPGVTALLVLGLATIAGALYLSTRAPPERQREVRHFQLGIGLWGLTVLYSTASIVLGQQMAFSTAEYGFTALAASVVAHDVKRFMEALAQSELNAESNASKHRALELLHRDVVRRSARVWWCSTPSNACDSGIRWRRSWPMCRPTAPWASGCGTCCASPRRTKRRWPPSWRRPPAAAR